MIQETQAAIVLNACKARKKNHIQNITRPQHLRRYVQASTGSTSACFTLRQLCNALHRPGHPHDPCLLWPKKPVVAFLPTVAKWIRFVLNVLALLELYADAHLQSSTCTVWEAVGAKSHEHSTHSILIWSYMVSRTIAWGSKAIHVPTTGSV